ncbi:unnamed protein product [Boreogadus saida]
MRKRGIESERERNPEEAQHNARTRGEGRRVRREIGRFKRTKCQKAGGDGKRVGLAHALALGQRGAPNLKAWFVYLPSAEGRGHMGSERGHRRHVSRDTQRQEETCPQVTGGGCEAFSHVCTIFSTSLHPALFYPQISSNEVVNMKAKNFK